MTRMLDLPPEIFEAVIDSTLCISGLRKTTKLREVCKSFDRSIRRAIYALPTFENEEICDSSDEFARDPRMSKAMVSGLILAKIHTGRDPEARVLCREIVRTVDFLVNALEQKDDDLRYTRALADAAANSLFLRDVVRNLAPNHGLEPSASQTLDNALVAAVSTNQVCLVKTILGMGARASMRTALFGEPLSAAARIGSTSMMSLLLDSAGVEKSTFDTFQFWLYRVNALAASALAGHENIVRILLDTKFQPIQPSSLYDYAVKVAVEAGNESIMELLLQHRMPKEFASNKTPFRVELLRTAVECGHENIVRRIIDTDPETLSENIFLLLEDASRCGHTGIARLLLSKMPHPIPEWPTGALYSAARRGDQDLVDLLLDYGAGVNLAAFGDALAGAGFSEQGQLTRHILKRHAATRSDTRTIQALERAAHTVRIDLKAAFDILLGVGIDHVPSSTYNGLVSKSRPKYVSRGERFPRKVVELLNNTSASGNLEKVSEDLSKYTAQYPDGNLNDFGSSWNAAASNNHPGVLSYLCTHVPGKFLTESALGTRSTAIFQVYLDFGWNINKPVYQTTPPALARVVADEHLTRWFLDRGADPNAEVDPVARGFTDLTPMSMAVMRASVSTIKLLLERGGTIKRGQLLHFAVERSDSCASEIVALLLDLGAPINKLQYEDKPTSWRLYKASGLGTPLHEAAAHGRKDLVSLLLGREADRTIRDTLGRVALELAEEAGHVEVVRVLRTEGAEVFG